MTMVSPPCVVLEAEPAPYWRPGAAGDKPKVPPPTVAKSDVIGLATCPAVTSASSRDERHRTFERRRLFETQRSKRRRSGRSKVESAHRAASLLRVEQLRRADRTGRRSVVASQARSGGPARAVRDRGQATSPRSDGRRHGSGSLRRGRERRRAAGALGRPGDRARARMVRRPPAALCPPRAKVAAPACAQAKMWVRAASQIAATAGCLILRSTEMA